MIVGRELIICLHCFVVLLYMQTNHVSARRKKYILKHIVTHCVSQPCGKHGNCVVDMSQKTGIICYCKEGFTGLRCENAIEECNETPCQNEGTCTNTEKGFSCSCKEEFTGIRCETNTQGKSIGKTTKKREDTDKVVKEADTLVGLIVFFVISCWVCGCATCYIYHRNVKKQKSYKYEESPLDFGDPSAIKTYADTAMEEKEREEERKEEEREKLLGRTKKEPEEEDKELPEVTYEGAVSSKAFGEDAIIEESAKFSPKKAKISGWKGEA